jgi:hypothetical protein
MIISADKTRQVSKIGEREVKKTILHISYDLRPSISTTAVRSLIEAAAGEFNNISVDLMRVASLSNEHIINHGEKYLEINSFGLPLSLFLISNLKRAGEKIFSTIKFNNDIDLIHAHKLTYEGYIGYIYARKFNIPLVLTLRQTDFELYKYRPDLRNIFREIIKYSSKIFYIVPGMKRLLIKQTGEDFYRQFVESKMVYLPNIVEGKHAIGFKKEYKRNNLLTVLRMTKSSVRRKNIKRLLSALSGIKDIDWKLNIIGSGEYLNKVEEWTEHFKLRDRINFLGKVDNQEINSFYSEAGAFILPSLMESFGMVYAESLLNGTPILYSKGVLGFEGVFNGVGPAVDPWSVESIRDGIRDVLTENEKYRRNIKKLAESGSFNIFKPVYIGERYIESLKGI